MKKVILTLGVLFIIQSAFSQTQNLGDWIVTVNTGIEAHDKRLFNYPPPSPEILLAKSPEFWGTYHLSLSVKRKVWRQKRFSSFLGIGVSYENAAFTRPFDHRHFVTGTTTDDIKILNRYKKVLTQLSLSAFYELGDHWFISGQVVSNFLVFRAVRNTEWSSEGYGTEGAFELDDVQLRLGLNGRIGRVIIGLHSRVVNFQKIDKIIFNDIIIDPRTDQKWEWYNPLRFDLTVGYTW
jgi:hypothetical protein